MGYSSRLLILIVAAATAQAVTASDGQIDFEGKLVTETCHVFLPDASNKYPLEDTDPLKSFVTLPTLSTSALARAGSVAGETRFTIALSRCSGTFKTAAVLFEPGHTVDPTSGNLKNSGSATNVQLQLIDAANGNAIKAGSASQISATTRFAINSEGEAELPYAVQYYAQAATGPGTVVSSVTYSINYQ
ncbi:fimbrial protein [Pseudomonas protegens]|uniref:fimbrial protein n=1 Tax=Pseudomonas protegens TaxID=380021 RepID=UPI000F4B77D6|nr:fimbrial protein [Pseudomonas protegens]